MTEMRQPSCPKVLTTVVLLFYRDFLGANMISIIANVRLQYGDKQPTKCSKLYRPQLSMNTEFEAIINGIIESRLSTEKDAEIPFELTIA